MPTSGTKEQTDKSITVSDHPDFDIAGNIYWNGYFSYCAKEEKKRINPYSKERPAHDIWNRGFNQSAQPTKYENYTGYIRGTSIKEEYEAGNMEALVASLRRCRYNDTAPEEWMIEAVTDLIHHKKSEEKGRHSNIERRWLDRVAHVVRYRAVAGCRIAYDGTIRRQSLYTGWSETVSSAWVKRKFGPRPSWEKVFENSSALLSGTMACCTPGTAKKSYITVKSDIDKHGVNSVYILSISATSIDNKYINKGRNTHKCTSILERLLLWEPPPWPQAASE